MMNFRAILLIAICAFATLSLNAQRYNIGIRAGLNYSKILGPSEEGLRETRKFNSGIHFGLTYSYKFTERFGLKTELGYSSIGSVDSIVGEGYYIFNPGIQNIVRKGYVSRVIERTNSHINIPIHAYFKPTEKLELFAGPYFGILINPTAGGTLNFDDQSDETKFSFIQSLDYNYYQDEQLEGKSNTPVTVIIDEQEIIMPQSVGAYYQFQNKNGGLYRWFDVGISGGFQYYINRSFFAGARFDYGLVDITRQAMDVSYGSIQENPTAFNLRDDFDQNFSMQFSLGFKF